MLAIISDLSNSFLYIFILFNNLYKLSYCSTYINACFAGKKNFDFQQISFGSLEALQIYFPCNINCFILTDSRVKRLKFT